MQLFSLKCSFHIYPNVSMVWTDRLQQGLSRQTRRRQAIWGRWIRERVQPPPTT
jgi:hypothetical protein